MRKLVKRFLNSSAFNNFCQRRRIREIFFFLSPRFTAFIAAEAKGLTYVVRTPDLSVSRELFVRRGFDDDVLPSVLSLLDHFGYSSCRRKTFVDIGANIGTSVIPAVHSFGFPHGIAFEPEPTNHQLIMVNALLNNVDKCITAHRLALTDNETQLVFEIAPDNSGDNRVRTTTGNYQVELHQESSRPTISVQGTTFDRLLDRGVLTLDEIGLIWMDTQGHEGHVFAGATRLLQSDVPILLEYWPYALTRSGGIDRLDQQIQRHYTHFIDVREQPEGGPPIATPVNQIGLLREKYRETMLTDLLLLKFTGEKRP